MSELSLATGKPAGSRMFDLAAGFILLSLMPKKLPGLLDVSAKCMACVLIIQGITGWNLLSASHNKSGRSQIFKGPVEGPVKPNNPEIVSANT